MNRIYWMEQGNIFLCAFIMFIMLIRLIMTRLKEQEEADTLRA